MVYLKIGVKGIEATIQELTNKYSSRVDQILVAKEADIMKV